MTQLLGRNESATREIFRRGSISDGTKSHRMLRVSTTLHFAASVVRRVPSKQHRCVARAMSGSALHDGMKFGPIDIPASQIFTETSLSVGLVNLKPVVPGHVLVVSKRVVPRFHDLSAEETSDLWSLVKRIGHVLEKHVGATSVTFALQDGKEAGQTVPHVHVHVLPRVTGDFTNNDHIYHEVEASGEREGERGVGGDGVGDSGDSVPSTSSKQSGRRFDPDAERVARSPDAMAREAIELRSLFQ